MRRRIPSRRLDDASALFENQGKPTEIDASALFENQGKSTEIDASTLFENQGKSTETDASTLFACDNSIPQAEEKVTLLIHFFSRLSVPLRSTRDSLSVEFESRGFYCE